MRTFRGLYVVNKTIRSPVELRRSPNPQTDGDGDRHHQNGYWHPILDVNAEDAESLDEDMQGRFLLLEPYGPCTGKDIIFIFRLVRPPRLPAHRFGERQRNGPSTGGSAEAVLVRGAVPVEDRHNSKTRSPATRSKMV